MKIPPVIPTCEALIEQLGSITHMQRGTLTEQYLQRPSPDGHGTVTLGPYFKFQVWEDGRNHTRSVPADEATALREDIANHHIFQQASQQLADQIIARTRQLRASQHAAKSDSAPTAEKKTSKPNASPKNTAKRSNSSPKPVSALSNKRPPKT